MFQDSFVKKIYPYRTTQMATAMSDKIYPSYVGSGECIISVDATGAQGLNNRLQNAYNGNPNAADMYVVGRNMVGDSISPNNTIPYGYIDYSVSIDGNRFDTEDILREAGRFYRSYDIYKSEVTNSFILNKELKLEVTTFIPYASKAVCFVIKAHNYHFMFPTTDRKMKVSIEMRLNMLTRDGRKVFDRVTMSDGIINTLVNGHEVYENEVKISNSLGAYATLNGEIASITAEFDVADEWTEVSYMFDFEGKNDVSQLDDMRIASIKAWSDYYDAHTIINSDNTDEVFMYNHSLYLFRMGFDPNYGFSIGHPFFFPACWEQCVFWDMHFMADGLLKTNDVDTVIKLTEYLKRTMRATGKAFPWMMIYDGTTFLDDKRDIAPLVISAHAMTAIKLYEDTLDKKLLSDLCYPIISRCCDYALTDLFKLEDTGWIIAKPISNDVVDEEGDEVNQTFTTVWFVSVIAKYVEYSDILGIQIDPRFRDIPVNYKLESDMEEYLHCRGFKASEFRWASWIPFLAYPTEGLRFLDHDLLVKTREKYSFIELYKDKQNCYQPWTECIEAQAAHRTGENEQAYKLLRTSFSRIFGDGYFAEVGPLMQTCGYPPYVSAHGAYLGAYTDMFATGDIWTGEVGLFTNMPSSIEAQRVEIRGAGIRCPKNVLVEWAEYTPLTLRAKLSGSLESRTVTMRIPLSMDENDIRVMVNGVQVNADINLRKRTAKYTFTSNDDVIIEVR